MSALLDEDPPPDMVMQVELDGAGSAPLLLDDAPQLNLLRKIERQYPLLEQVGCKVGIGVATGCDRVFIDSFEALPVEEERKIPLVMAKDLVEGDIRWSGKGVLNPFDGSGRLVPLESFPRFNDYVRAHRASLIERHVARRNPDGWYRTIDRIQPGLRETPKILVPDIKGEGVFVLDNGLYYPHHNLYFITSEQWDLKALQAVLRSSLTLVTVSTYCTRMAGGFLRFQAQYLRRIRVPSWSEVSEASRKKLIAASSAIQQAEIDGPVFELYGLNEEEAALIRDSASAVRIGKGSIQ